MELIQASQVGAERLEQFLKANEHIKMDSLLNNGYVVEYHNKIIGCFELQAMDQGAYWLKQLYIIRNEAVKLPVLLEFILLYAKNKNAEVIYAHSEQPVTDLLLESLHFSLQTETAVHMAHARHKRGHWWSYKVC